MIWHPNITCKRWMEIHPTFKEDLPLHCICGKEVWDVTPFVTAYSVGISTGECDCGIHAATTISKPRNQSLTFYLVALLNNLI
jgi:hypothetical protein